MRQKKTAPPKGKFLVQCVRCKRMSQKSDMLLRYTKQGVVWRCEGHGE